MKLHYLVFIGENMRLWMKIIILTRERSRIMRIIQRLAVFLAASVILAGIGCAGTETSRSTGTYIDDDTITTKVETKLAEDSLTEAMQVDVETYKGVVQLSGFVDDEAIKDRAADLAWSVEGVKGVKNNLIVRK
jgi:hyperosmotically inducible protein